MSVQRYLPSTIGTAFTGMVPAVSGGDYVLHTDYAALEERCAGLERERDDAKLAHTHAEQRNSVLVQNLKDAKDDRDSARKGVDDLLRMLGVAEQQRDALQAKLAAAVKTLDSIICLAVEGPDGFGSALKACQAIQKEAAAALADTTTGEVQP